MDLKIMVREYYAHLDTCGISDDKMALADLPNVLRVKLRSQIVELCFHARSSMLEVMNANFIRTARAKGLPQRSIIWRHAMTCCSSSCVMPTMPFAVGMKCCCTAVGGGAP